MFPKNRISNKFYTLSLCCIASFSMADTVNNVTRYAPTNAITTTNTVVTTSIIEHTENQHGRVNRIADFSTENIDNWKAKSFVGETSYTIVNDGDKRVLKAYSSDTASGLAKETIIDLFETPYLNWSWKIDNTLPNLDETIKDGDDYAARVYVVKSGGWKIWNTLALNYVWSSNQDKDAQWNNAFVGENAKMHAVKGKADNIAVWATEKRNVYQDMINQFGDKGSDKKNEEAYRYLDAVALMTDTDNSHLSAVAYYADIYFSEK